jgi:hypothetical protein
VPPTGRIQPRAARRHLTAEEDGLQSDLQARCPTGAVRPPPRSPTRKNTPPDAGVSAAPQEERGNSLPRSLLAPRVVPRGQLRWRCGGGGGRDGGEGREWESPPVSPLRRRGGPQTSFPQTTDVIYELHCLTQVSYRFSLLFRGAKLSCEIDRAPPGCSPQPPAACSSPCVFVSAYLQVPKHKRRDDSRSSWA